MSDPASVVVVGGGPAGVGAAVALAEAGCIVTLVEQRDRLGGAIHRQPAHGGKPAVRQPLHIFRDWSALMSRLEAVSRRIELKLSTVFLGVDGRGSFLFDDRGEGRTIALRPQACVVATGAVEKVVPFKGWEQPGVITAGAAQLLMKETGDFPEGPILVAGSGPLLLAVAAQLARAGRAPLGVLERASRPAIRDLAGLTIGPRQVLEGMGYIATLLTRRIPVAFDASIISAYRIGDLLRVTFRHGPVERQHDVRHVLIHDGIEPNRVLLPPAGCGGTITVMAGDGREIVGGHAASLDGEDAAAKVLDALGIGGQSRSRRAVARARAFQRSLERVYRTGSNPLLSSDTIICPCEGGCASDLDDLGPELSGREIRLLSRFGMGACQGRFCGPILRSMERALPDQAPRWPIRPVSVSSLANFDVQAPHRTGETNP